ncbi:unnamed protein product [Sphagnum troendelagicum]|uniref:Uncharacterized protein n=1 Tax=Sphagnum troendelagicum TaxID=128251 RepID=A0ABP0U6W4_9BRYO
MHKWKEKMHDRTGIADLKRAYPQNEFRRVVADDDDDTSQFPPKQHNQEICKLGNKEKAKRGGAGGINLVTDLQRNESWERKQQATAVK